MNVLGQALTSKTDLFDPLWEDWEAVRRLVTKLWYEQGKSIDSVVHLLQSEYRVKVS